MTARFRLPRLIADKPIAVGMRPKPSRRTRHSLLRGLIMPPVERDLAAATACVMKRVAGVSAARGDRTGLLFHRATPAAIQASQHGDDQTRIEVHRSFIQHRSLALITSIHVFTITRSIMRAYQSKAPFVRRKRPPDQFVNESFRPADLDCSACQK
jgi:hypothetical protein